MVRMANNRKPAVPQVRASGCTPSKECGTSYPTKCDSTSFNVGKLPLELKISVLFTACWLVWDFYCQKDHDSIMFVSK